MRLLGRLVCAFAVLGMFLSNGEATQKPQQDIPDNPAEEIAYAGHGKLFDKQMKEVKLDTASITRIQDAMMNLILKAKPEPRPDTVPVIKEAEQFLKWKKLTTGETILIKGGIIATLLQNSSEDLRTIYSWRNSAVLSDYFGHDPKLLTILDPRAAALARRLGVLDMEPDPPASGPTPYMNLCRLLSVPVPPDWAQSGTPWVWQGTLSQNLLDPGGYAEVWTYSDPSVQGGCIALPRGSGDFGSVAGIICQSFITGAACFWDNKLRGVSPEQPIGWHDQRLVISELKDGSNLEDSCTQCHRGNNVFLIAPDDPTWGKVLRGPLNGPRTGTFTTQVMTTGPLSVSRYTDRYFPVTGLPDRRGWENNFTTSSTTGVCTECHDRAVVLAPRMPPLCATGRTDPAGCYGTP